MRLAALRRPKTAVLAGVVVVGLPTAVFLAQSDAAMGTAQSTQSTFTVVEQPGTFHFVDLPPAQKHPNSASAGDEFVFINTLTQGGNRVGRAQAGCTFTKAGHAKNPLLQCEGSFMLHGSELTVAGAIALNSNTMHIAITGGTGKYEGAGGQIIAVNHPDGSSTDTVHVILP